MGDNLSDSIRIIFLIQIFYYANLYPQAHLITEIELVIFAKKHIDLLRNNVMYTVYPIIKQKVCERDLSCELICTKTLL